MSTDDLIFVFLQTGDRQPSQKLNLRVFDSNNNILRTANDIAGEVSFIFTNLNNPLQIEDSNQFNFLEKFSPKRDKISKKITNNNEKYGDLLNPYSGSSFINICFDNIFYDRSWNFKQQTRDVDLRVHIKNASSVLQFNYNEIAKYFTRLNLAEESNTGSTVRFKQEFTEKEFDEAAKILSAQLERISEQLRSSKEVLNTLREVESRLRDVNEAIFAKYTKTSIAVLASIFVFGLLQIVYFKFYLRRKQII